jgi:hypothetical protein
LANLNRSSGGLGVEHTASPKQQQDLLAEAARFGIRHGFTVPIHNNSGPIAAVTFAVDERLTFL